MLDVLSKLGVECHDGEKIGVQQQQWKEQEGNLTETDEAQTSYSTAEQQHQLKWHEGSEIEKRELPIV